MKGDFARVTYDATRHIRRVMRQQGRVEVEADGNEQVAVLLHQLEAMMGDLVGPYAVPRPEISGGRDGFAVSGDGDFDLRIAAGHIWIDGVLCENDAPDGVAFSEQPDLPAGKPSQAGKYLVYLDVWERHLCVDEAPWTREVALGGPDTASRSKLVWQAKLVDEVPTQFTAAAVRKNWGELVETWQPANRGLLAARAEAPAGASDPCVMPPDSQYRGPENQLYRVEVRDTGEAGTATFVWSRDNGTVVYPIRRVRGSAVTVDRLPVDPRYAPVARQWVEVCDDESALGGEPGPLCQVVAVDADESIVELDVPATDPLPAFDEESTTHPLLRRWDQSGPAITIEEGTWFDLEDGVQVRFDAGDDGAPAHRYRTGDHWMIPARVATGDVEWAEEAGVPVALPPHGVLHHYAPLAIVTFDAGGAATNLIDVRRRIAKLWEDL